MFALVYEFLGLAGLETYPTNLAELIPYLLQFLVACVLVLGVFKVLGGIAAFFMNWRVFSK